ncbi:MULTISPECIES: hypothetical protein [Paenibacillus]|uniref:hypothetical protein n=1 Tax=Paenibacillus TaxID=44249 RepID=UPI0022B92B72|nr:hypothetical protein [Paenibacillus caseinilyticus]MCZ8523039.1 hypothetical protein [Paenibacillus caseinilyticus]
MLRSFLLDYLKTLVLTCGLMVILSAGLIPYTADAASMMQGSGLPTANEGAHVHEHGEVDWKKSASHALTLFDSLAVILVCGFLSYKYWIGQQDRLQIPFGYSLQVERRLLMVVFGASVCAGGVAIGLLTAQQSTAGIQTQHWVDRILQTGWAGITALVKPVIAAFLLLLTFDPAGEHSRFGKWLKTLLVLMWALFLPMSNHTAGTLESMGFVIAAKFIYLICSGVWFGGVLGLYIATFVRSPSLETLWNWYGLFKRYTQWVLPAVLLLAAAAVGEAIRNPSNERVVGGQQMLLNITILLAVIGFGIFTRYACSLSMCRMLNETPCEQDKTGSRFISGLRIDLVLAAIAIGAAGTSLASPSTEFNDTSSSTPVYWHVMGERAHMSLRVNTIHGSMQTIKLDAWLPTGLGAPVEPKVVYSREPDGGLGTQAISLDYISGGPDPYGFEGFDKFTFAAPAGRHFSDPGSWRVQVMFSDSSGYNHQYEKVVHIP